MTYKEFHGKTQNELRAIYDEQESENITWMLMEDATGYSRSKLRSLDREEIPETFVFRVYKYLHGLMQQQPVQYALGYTWFYKQKFSVNPSVLIPRSETEELVYRIIKECRGRKVSILDIGTGSGCIAISLQLEIPDAEITAIDFSAEALETARENAVALKADKICFDQIDILKETDWGKLGQYNVLVSNPPYITEEEKKDMQPNVLQHEPHSALFVTNHDPLQFYKAITAFAQMHLKKGGHLFFECNEKYAIQTEKLLKQNGFDAVEVLKDMQGKPRIVTSIKNT
ncbi:MAG: peptide chain release factor N(5)-glutamine methyltransferase [Bacteroidia bacterium]|nr:peptide chain release factor N(5)-glutamine methyltransferase [Bacteroidia bacterium]